MGESSALSGVVWLVLLGAAAFAVNWTWRQLRAPFRRQSVGHTTNRTPWEIMRSFLLTVGFVMGFLWLVWYEPTRSILMQIAVAALRSVADLLDVIADVIYRYIPRDAFRMFI